MSEVKRMREYKKVYMLVVLEGDGTLESPMREVRYFFDDDRDQTFLAKDDPHNQYERQ